MARKTIDIGAIGNDGTGDSIRDSFRKVNDNFRELYSSLGLGENLTFIGLDDTPSTYVGQENEIVVVNSTETGLAFKKLSPGIGISLDFDSNPNEIILSSDFSAIVGDTAPQLGGNLSLRSGGNQYRILDAGTTISPLTPIFKHELVNKAYADSKIARAGTSAINPETGLVDGSFGTMSGPLILSRSPEPDDDVTYGGLIAATKQYVDSSAFGSVSNLYVALSGSDDRPGASKALQGRALAYAYRTLEAALKRAEELVLEAREEIGPYRKVLTYNNGASLCTLIDKDNAAPGSGSGFAGTLRMAVSTLTLNSIGVNYYPGDILSLVGGAGTSIATIEVLTTITTPGGISTFRIISAGGYTTLPGATAVTTTITTSAAPVGVGPIGVLASFNITYKVSSVAITSGGTGYGLVSVRATGGGGVGAFGFAVVTAGVITNISITDGGTGFTSIPSLLVNLPRFLIRTDGYRTDSTGDVLTNTAEALRGRDIREGLYLFGETSGALAQILAHSGALDSSGNEIFDVDIKYGNFELGENISFGDVSKRIHITINLESGIYEENYPLKVPQNTSIVGDEFRRCIIRPRAGTSSSPWAFNKFRRDITIDGLTVASNLYGYHYLQNSSQPVYPKVNNKGGYRAAAELIDLNREFLQNDVIAWIDAQILANIAPFTSTFVYNSLLCKRDLGLIIDALTFDLRYSEYNRTISAGLKYYQSASGLIAIGAQLSQTLAAITRLDFLIGNVLSNATVVPSQTAYLQVIDLAYSAESGSITVVSALIAALKDVMDGSGSVNYPKENDQLDVFLANDAVRWQAITAQGHGGFMLTLDPTGQILAKSPYAQECASFSKSINAQTFAGGMFVDGFVGNLQFKHASTTTGVGIVTGTRLNVTGLDRLPQLPASFLVNDTVFRVNYVRDYVYSTTGSSATFVVDDGSPFLVTAGSQTCTISTASPAVVTRADHRLQAGAILEFSSTGSLPTGISAGVEYYVLADGLSNNTFKITDTFGSITAVNVTAPGTGVLSYQRTYELLMPGNRSMLGNDYTQINDMGYGIVTTNGGLIEAVSVFTYYCYTSYYSINGGQIRSVAGSSAHGIYALVAEGADPLEIPTPTDIFEDLAQKVRCYFPSSPYANTAGGLFVYVDGYDYVPLNSSELEVIHVISGQNTVFRYPITAVTTSEIYPTGVVRLNLGEGVTTNTGGLAAIIPDNTVMTLRSKAQIILTGSLEDVAVRPSTGLKLRETASTVYRVLEFIAYTDLNGPYEVVISNGSPAVLQVLATVTDIATNVCTTSQNHKLKIGDKFIPTSTANNFVSGTTYFIISVPEYNQFTVSATLGGSVFTLVDGAGLTIKGVKTHKLLENYTITINTTGILPLGLITPETYYVVSTGLTDTQFSISLTKNGAVVATGTAGSGIHSYAMVGLTKTDLRENYDYIDLSIRQPGEFISAAPTGTEVSSINTTGTALINTTAAHGFSAGDVIKFTTSTSAIDLPVGLSKNVHYHVIASGLTPTAFQLSESPGGTAQTVTGGSFVNARVGLVSGRAGDSTFAVVAVGPSDTSRVNNSRLLYLGEEYVITLYEPELVTGQPYARITLNRPLVNSIISYEGMYTIRAAVPPRSNGAQGTLTIRIALTRVTGHDLLEIGTGSYADTNYPNEIFGGPVNPADEATEVIERDVGRVFYVTTDQFGNFKVGPYFKVDQGTGTVTFAAQIALSNLDGIGFKRGVTVSEFSIESSMSALRTDTVPTENAVALHVQRRLGTLADGSGISDLTSLIPANIGGFMALNGVLSMKAAMDLGNNRIVNLDDPVSGGDAVNLQSLTLDNIQGISLNNIQAADTLVFTGVGNSVLNARVTGDITFDLAPGVDSTLNTVNAQIVAGSIIDADINAAAAIAYSKLNLANNIVNADISATAAIAYSKLNLANSIVNADVSATAAIQLSKLATMAPDTLVGNSTIVSATPGAVAFSTVIDEGLGIKKSQYNSAGFLKRISGVSNVADVDYSIINSSAGLPTAVGASELIARDVNGDFGGRNASIQQLYVGPGSVGDTKLAVQGVGAGFIGYVGYYGWTSNAAMFINDSSVTADKKTQYWNNFHEFKTQSGAALAPITCSSVAATTLTAGGNTSAGTIIGQWSLSGVSRMQATYAADLAENYEGDELYEVGTVLVFGGNKEVTTTDIKGDTRVAGVVSNTAAYTMYEACPGLKNLIALQGRVPCKVVGKIRKGDILITSGIPGVAVAAIGDIRVGTVVGKAIKDYDSDHIGLVEIAVGRT